MATSPVIVTQVLTPGKRSDLLRRQRLVDFMHEHIDRKLLLISASAGYGKTSLLADYAHDTDLPVCWFTAVESARSPRVFLDYLISAIQQSFPLFGAKSRQLLLAAEQSPDPMLIVGTLVNEIYETIRDFFVVIIDDYHLVDTSQTVNQVLDALVQHLPENCHIIISSRTVPTLTPRGLALLTARQQIAGLGVDDLRFTAPEIKQLFLQNYSQELSDEAAKELAEKSEGWITGILLTSHTMWKGLLQGMIRVKGSDSKVYDYLANEVFQQQPLELQQFLLSTAILEEMNPVLCDELLGVTNSRELLKLLEDKNLFVTRLERGEDRWYRYHHLFHDFLRAKLHEEQPARIRDLHARAAALLRAAGAVEQAIQHYLLVEDYDSAVRAILGIAREAFDAGKLEPLASWIDALPAERISDQPRLLWMRAKIHAEVGELDQAISLFDQSYAGFARAADVLGQARASIEKSAVLRLRGDLRRAIEACQQALTLAERVKEEKDALSVVASAHRQMGTGLASLGELEAGERELREALRAYESMGYDTNIGYVHNDLGVILRLAGNLGGSEVHFRQALDIWERIGNIGLAAMTINNIAIGHYYRGEYAEALQLYQVGLAHARKAGLDRPTAFILAGIGDIHRDRGAYADALKAYQDGLGPARQSREAFIVGYLLDAIGNTHRLMGNLSAASTHVRQAYERAQAREAVYEMGLYQVSLGMIAYQEGDIRQAEQSLTSARGIFERSSAKSEWAKASLYLAQIHYTAGRFDDAMQGVRDVVECLASLGFYQFLLPVVRETSRVLEYAASHGMADERLTEMLRQSTEALEKNVSPARAPEATAVQPILRLLLLGEARVWRDDKLISNSEFGMAKARELLFYLLIYRQRTKEQIATDLWPDLSTAKVRSSFHVALYRLRRAVQQQDCITFADDQYSFNRQINYWFDVEEFEQACRKGKAAWRVSPEAAAQHLRDAVSLYRGDFLEDQATGQTWWILKREELLDKYLDALQLLGDHCARHQDHREAIRFYTQAVLKDRYMEAAHRGIMRSQALSGQRNEALKTYHRLAEFLEQEFEADPSPESTQLYEQILHDSL